MSLLLSFWIYASIFLFAVKGARYEFVLDNDEIFDNCPEIPGNNGIHDLFDISDVDIQFMDSSVQCTGNITCAWEGVQPTDRIAGRAELYKYQRGAWQPTPFTAALEDFCQKQFENSAIWYQVWCSNIAQDERKCLNNFGHVYHHQPFVVDTVLDYVVNMDGRHKVVVRSEAFDEHNIKRPKTICFQIFGEFVKVK